MSDPYDIVYIGSGPAGYVGAIKAAQLGLKTACIEEHSSLGGTCLNVGCVPSKALLHAADLFALIHREAPEMGFDIPTATVNLTTLMQYKDKIVKKLSSGIQYLFKKNSVDHIRGHGRLISPTTIDVDGKTIHAKHIVLATGSQPATLPNIVLDEKKIVSSTGALSLSEIPKKLLIVGGGVIGLELGSVYHCLGSQVEVIEFMDRILPEFDTDLSSAFQKILQSRGFSIHLNSKVTNASNHNDVIQLTVEKQGETVNFEGDIALVSIGRRPNTNNLGLEALNIATDQRGFIQIDQAFRTNVPNIFAVGDVAGQPMLAHKGSHEAITVAYAVAGHHHPFDYTAIPNVVYTNPEIASVGFSENQLKERNIPYKVATFNLIGNSRYQANGGVEPGFVKALAHKETDHLLGCHILAPNASELICLPTLALQHRLTTKQLAHTCYPHPTISEALHEVFLGLTSQFIHL